MTDPTTIRGRLGRIKRTLLNFGTHTPYVPDPASTGLGKSALRLDLSGRVALVTGASGELGHVIARTLGACGAKIAIHYFSNQKRGEALGRELDEMRIPHCLVSGNVSSMPSTLAMRDEIAEQLGPVDIVVSNAVSWHPKKTILEQSLEAFDDMHRLCVMQTVVLAKVFVPSMTERRWGRIIGISTEVAMQALPHHGDYTAGKRGMDGVLRVLAREVGPDGITVNQIAPGWIITDRDRMQATERQPEYERLVPLKRRGFDQDVANAVAFLASDLASFITGVYLPVSGGNVMPAI